MVHIINDAALPWGRWHFTRSAGQFEVFLTHTAELKVACPRSFPPQRLSFGWLSELKLR